MPDPNDPIEPSRYDLDDTPTLDEADAPPPSPAAVWPAYDWTGARVAVAGPPTLAERLAPYEARIAELEARVPLGQILGPFMLRRDPHRHEGAPPWTAAIPSVGRGDGATPEAALHALAVAVGRRVEELEAERDAVLAELGRLRSAVETLGKAGRERRREIRRLRAELDGYADLPPEPDASPLAALLGVLAVDCDATHEWGGGDCGR